MKDRKVHKTPDKVPRSFSVDVILDNQITEAGVESVLWAVNHQRTTLGSAHPSNVSGTGIMRLYLAVSCIIIIITSITCIVPLVKG